jgi:CxxC motif-containing protein (DUF1111 family)
MSFPFAPMVVFLGATVLAAHSSSEGDRGVAAADHEELSGGETTVFDEGIKAFGFPATNLREERRASFFIGHSFFNQNWVAAPASTPARDGLGPLFNARSCGACHFRDGRSQPPEKGEPFVTMVLRISVPGPGEHNAPRPDPVYGGQIQGKAIPGVLAEANVYVTYQEVAGEFADGQKFCLRKPTYSIKDTAYGPLATNLLLSARVAPQMIGLGLLEAVPAETLQTLVEQQRKSGTVVRGRMNQVWDASTGKMRVGRFGWKAEQPTVLHQAAGAFAEDIGITSTIVTAENHTPNEKLCLKQVPGGSPEIGDKIFHDVVTYSRTLAVPARRNVQDPTVRRGEQLFNSIGCAICHVPKLQTGSAPDLPELSNQTIRPYTDLLLHDMGEGLADHRPLFDSSGRDWRTPPLWGIGLIQKVNNHTCLLHDGRARNFVEAILWHGGEAEAARGSFRCLNQVDREALAVFLQSL